MAVKVDVLWAKSPVEASGDIGGAFAVVVGDDVVVDDTIHCEVRVQRTTVVCVFGIHDCPGTVAGAIGGAAIREHAVGDDSLPV